MAINPYATIDELGAMLRNKQVSAVELANFYLARLEKFGEKFPNGPDELKALFRLLCMVTALSSEKR